MKHLFAISLLCSFLILPLCAAQHEQFIQSTCREEFTIGSQQFSDKIGENTVLGYQLTKGADSPHAAVSFNISDAGKIVFRAIALSQEYVEKLESSTTPYEFSAQDRMNGNSLVTTYTGDKKVFNNTFSGWSAVTYQFPEGNKHGIESITVQFTQKEDFLNGLIGTINHKDNRVGGLSTFAATAALHLHQARSIDFLAFGAHEVAIKFRRQ